MVEGGSLPLQMLCVANILCGVVNLVPYLRQWKLLKARNPDVALVPLLLCLIVLSATCLLGLSVHSSKVLCAVEGVLFHATLLEFEFLLTYYMYSVWRIIKVKQDTKIQVKSVWAIYLGSFAFWLFAFAATPYIFTHGHRGYVKDGLLCSPRNCRVEVLLFTPSFVLSLLLMYTAINVAFYTFKLRRRTRDVFLGFYLRFCAYACLNGLLVVCGTSVKILESVTGSRLAYSAPTREIGLCLIMISSLLGLVIIATSPIFRSQCLGMVGSAPRRRSKSDVSSVQSSSEGSASTTMTDKDNSAYDYFEEIPLGEELVDEHYDVRCA